MQYTYEIASTLPPAQVTTAKLTAATIIFNKKMITLFLSKLSAGE